MKKVSWLSRLVARLEGKYDRVYTPPRTCGRIMAKHRALYGWEKPKGPAKPKKEMPFKATRRHEFWSIDVRYIEHPRKLFQDAACLCHLGKAGHCLIFTGVRKSSA